jgi:nitroreductase
MFDLLKLIKKRQSSRVPFDSEKFISKLDLQKILEAGSWAPTAHNMQNFEVVVVDDKKLLEKKEILNSLLQKLLFRKIICNYLFLKKI